MKAGERLLWFVNRLRTMDVQEVVFRAGRSTQARFEWLLTHAPRTEKAPEFGDVTNAAAWVLTPTTVNVGDYVAAADKVLSGKQQLLWKELAETFPPDWTRNPVSHHKMPNTFGKLIDYRQIDNVGDIKYYWVLNRHHQTLVLAQAYALTKEDKYLQGVASLLRSWLEANPYPQGPNWTSSLELAIRLINWSAVFSLCEGLDGPLFKGLTGKRLRDDWLRSIYCHCHFIKGHLSRYSSANNHLIGELAGLFVAALSWPYWPDFSAYADYAQREIEQEVVRQITDDGVSREQTTFYEHFVLEFLIAAGTVGTAAGRELSATFWTRVEGLLAHLAALRSVAGHIPAIGDGDDALVLPLTPSQRDQPFKNMLRLGALLFSQPGYLPDAGEALHMADWLVPQAQDKETKLRTTASDFERRKTFPEGGYLVLGDDFGGPREVLCVFDVGGLGYLSIAAHGHADALAITLSLGGQPILVDPGTYSYQSDKDWRDYFRGTAAHNTVFVDGKNQAEIGGKFMWLTAFQGKSESYSSDSDQDRAEGSHDGYLRLSDPVMHKRRICYSKKNALLVVEDTIEAAGSHDVTRHWHFGPDVEVTATDRGLLATSGDIEVELTCMDGELQLARGSTEPLTGWNSPRFGEKEPIWTAAFHAKSTGDAVFTTKFAIRQAS